MKEVILLGGGRSVEDCPFNGTEIWATPKAIRMLDPVSDCSKVFINGNPYKNRGHIDFAQRNNIPIVSIEDYATESFPLREIVQRFKLNYFRCTFVYMLAYAIYLGYEKIHIYGMGRGEEWRSMQDRPRITWWLGIARGLEIEVDIARNCKLWAIMQQGIEREYKVREHMNNLEDSVFMQEAMKHGDPYCFVSGIDKDAITVTCSDDKGKVISEWHP